MRDGASRLFGPGGSGGRNRRDAATITRSTEPAGAQPGAVVGAPRTYWAAAIRRCTIEHTLRMSVMMNISLVGKGRPLCIP